MTAPVTLYPTVLTVNVVADSLQDVLASTYGLYFATHNYHWNVEGKNFSPLHLLFDGQYNELFIAIDSIAERIRALGAYALPFEGDSILQLSKLTSNPLNKETAADDRAERMVRNLIELNDAIVVRCQASKSVAQAAHDDESENLLIERITAHQKALWMLRSVVK